MGASRLIGITFALSSLLVAAPAGAQDFYRGKAVMMIIPSSAGGGYDMYARLLARHMGQHIAGKPDIVPQNMPGAGGKTAVSYVASIAPKDGTVIAASYPQALTEQAFGRRELVKYDTPSLTYIGSMNGEPYYCYVRGDAGVSNLRELQSKELIVGATGQGSSTATSPLLLNNLIGTRFKIVNGYKGSSEVILAALKNEVQGWCGMGWSSIQGAPAAEIEKGEIRILFQENGGSDPRVKSAGRIELATDFAQSEDDRRIMNLIYSQQAFGRPFLAPPGIPEARTRELRAAFDAAMKDPGLIADAKRLKAELTPISGADLQKMIVDLYATPPALLDRARFALEEPAPAATSKSRN
jgi:tripartite-type tricarboxylate transporter receptor subunit TctC